MADDPIARPLTLLTIPFELRQTIYHHLFATETDRELRLCTGCYSLWLAVPAPVQVLITCHQVHDEAFEIFVGSLGKIKLLFSGCKARDCSRNTPMPFEHSILASYGKLVAEVHLRDEQAMYVSLQEVLDCCPGVQKLVVDTRPISIDILTEGDETEEWYLESTWVEEWLWELWKERIPVTWVGCYHSQLVDILNGQKGEGQNYEVNFIADFEFITGFDNWLEVVFNGDTGATVKREFVYPFEASRLIDDDDEEINEPRH